MKTIIARFTELKENVAGTADSEFDDLDYNKVDTALKSVGVSLKDAAGQFRDLDDVFLELAGKWSTLDRNSQRYIATIAAGARQQSRFIAMMDNYDRTMELVNVAYDSNGKASEQFGKYADTLEYKLNQLTNTWEQMRLKFLNSDFLKGAIDLLNNLMIKISNIKPEKLIATIIVALTAGKKAISNFLNFGQNKIKIILDFIGSDKKQKPIERMKEKVNDLKNIIKEPSKINVDTTDAETKINKLIIKKRELEGTSKTDTSETNNETNNSSDFEVAEGPVATRSIDNKEISNIAPKLTENLSNELGESLENAGNSSQVKKATINLKEKFNAIGNALSSSLTVGFAAMNMTDNPLLIFSSVLMSALPAVIAEVVACGGAITTAFWTSTAGIGLIISLIIGAATATYAAVTAIFDKIDSNSFENRAKAAQETAEKAKETAEEAKMAAKEATDVYNNTEQLKERFNELNTKQILSVEEQEEYNSLVQQIQDEFPEIISYYNKTTGELRVQNELWEGILDKQKASAKAAYKNEIASTIAYSAAQTEANEYDTISQYTEKTGIKGEFLEEYLNTGKNFNDLITELNNVTKGINENSLLYSIDADDYGYLTDWIDFEAIGNLYDIEDPTGEGFLQTVQALDEHKDELKESLSGLEQTINDIAQQQYDMIAKNFSDVLKEMNPDMGEGEAALFGALAAEKTNMNVLTAEDYNKKMGLDSDFMQGLSTVYEWTQWANWLNPFEDNKESGFFFDALGGDLGGPSGNELSDWEDLDIEDEIIGLEEYGIETVGDVKNAFKGLYGSAVEAEKEWNELAKTAEGQREIFSKVVGAAASEQAQKEIEEIQKNITDEQRNQLNELYAKTMEGGVTQDELDQYKDFLVNELGLVQGSLSYNNLVGDLEKSLNDAQQRLEKYNLPNILWKDWSTDQMNQYANQMDQLSAKIGQEAAEKYSEELLQGFKNSGLSDEDIFNVLSSVDWSTVTLGNLDETKRNFVSMMETAMGDSFDPEKVDKIWQDFFDAANKYNVVDLSINSDAALEDIEKSITDRGTLMIDKLSGMSSIISEQIENGFISFSSSQKVESALAELGLKASEYLTYNPNGETNFNTEKLITDLMNDESLLADQMLEAARQETQAKIDTLSAQLANLQAANGNTEAALNTAKAYGLSVEALQTMYNLMVDMGTIEGSKINVGYSLEGIENINIDYTDQIKQTEEDIEKLQSYLDNDLQKGTETYNKLVGQAAGIQNELLSTYTDAVNKGVEAKNKDTSSSKKAADATDKLREAQEKLNEALYGTENYKNAADHLANYTKRLEELTDKANKAKESLENLGKEDSASELIATYAENVKLENVTRTAENQVLQQSMDDLLKILNEQYSEYFQKVGDTWMWNASVVDAQMNDNEKDYIIESIENLNEYQDKINENLDAIEKREKEFKEMRKTALDSRIALEEEVMDVLKENYQKEIDAAQEKYDALKEADDNYLDALEEAINKQRELRDRANQYEDLAQKERKLALKQRDTSGANRKDTLQLEQEVEESRQDMLDNEVDRLLESMKEMYELQQESREAELEYMNAMVENGQLLQEANEIIASFSTREDMLAWFFENNQELADMSVAATEKYKMELEDMYDAAELYYAMSETNLEELTSFTEDEVADTVATIGETLTLEAERSYNEMRETVDKEVEDAKQAVIDAQKAVEDAAAGSASAVGSAAGAMIQAANDIKNAFADAGEQKTIVQQYGLNTVQGVEEWNKAHPDQQVSTSAALAENGKTVKKSQPTNNGNNKTTTASSTSYGALKAQEYTQQAKQKSQAVIASTNMQKSMQQYGKSTYGYVAVVDGIAIPFTKNSTANKQLISYLENRGKSNYYIKDKLNKKVSLSFLKAEYGYLNGGLVDYTGPAWVDGTPSKPEAFLNSEDTKRIGEAAKLLSNLPILNSTSSASTPLSTNIGDTSIEIHINVESISSDYDVDRLAERIKSDIVDASKPVGSPVILKR